MISTIVEFKNGMTVKELKELIKDWPETREDGELTEVWVGDYRGMSNIAIELCRLNLDSDGSCDLLISHGN